MTPEVLSEILALSAQIRTSTDPGTIAALSAVITTLSSLSAPATLPAGQTTLTNSPFNQPYVATPQTQAVVPAPHPSVPSRVLPMTDADAYLNGDTTRASAKAAAWAATQLATRAGVEVLGANGSIDVRLAVYPGLPHIDPVRMLWNPSGNGIANAAEAYRSFAYGDGSTSLSDLKTAMGGPKNTANLDGLVGIDPEFSAFPKA